MKSPRAGLSLFETAHCVVHTFVTPSHFTSELTHFDDMDDHVDILSAEEMKHRYGSFYDQSPRLRLDRSKVPERFWPLLPYAEFWGFPDDWTRQDLVEQAPPEVQRNLKHVVSNFDSALDEWLAGPESAGPSFSDEYIAFTALRMAADFV